MLTLILDPTNPLTVPPGEQNGAGPAIPERPDDQEEFNFLGGRPGGVGLEEAQEQKRNRKRDQPGRPSLSPYLHYVPVRPSV